MQALAELFVKEDASLVEINPIVVTREGEIIALDAKINFAPVRKPTRATLSAKAGPMPLASSR